MLENFIYTKQKSLFEKALNNGEVLNEAIVFIEDTKEIWNHGTYFDGSTVDLSNIEASILNILDTKADKSEIPTKVSDLENDKNYIENGDGYDSGVYIAVQSGKLINPDEYDSTTETAIGVAVIDPKANFIIGLNHTNPIPWGTSEQGLYTDISGLTNYSNTTTAITDIGGIANTNVITNIYSGTDCAAGLAKSQSITYGSNSLTGYLGSAGEWDIVSDNYVVIRSAMAIAGGNCFQSTSYLYYWTSTEFSYNIAWNARFRNDLVLGLNTFEKSLSDADVSFSVVPFYKIDNEITISTKINFITTPAGSSTAPIYIDSNGNISSTTYGGGTKIALNGTDKGGSSTSFYAPTLAGTSGYILTSNGSGAPSWKQKMPISEKSSTFTASLGNYYHLYLNDNYTISVPSVGTSAEEINFCINTDGSSRSISFVDSNGENLTQISNEDFTALQANTRYLASVVTNNVILIKAADETIPKITFTMLINSVYKNNNYVGVTGVIYASQAPSSDIPINIYLHCKRRDTSSSITLLSSLLFSAGSTQNNFDVNKYVSGSSNYNWIVLANNSSCRYKGFYKGMYIIDDLV